VLLPYPDLKVIHIRAKQKKKLDIISVLPDEIEVLPWAGHLGAKMVDKILPIIASNTTTLIFTNTRGQAELWYQLLLSAQPDLAGLISNTSWVYRQETSQLD
jgi:ATP-dependent Lhr-like helicase